MIVGSHPCSTTTGTNPTRIGRLGLHGSRSPARKSGASACPMVACMSVNCATMRQQARAGTSQIFEGPELLLVSRRCDSEQHARRVAEMAKGDYLRQECVAIEKG